jgi:carbohydrate-selective porin OprB
MPNGFFGMKVLDGVGRQLIEDGIEVGQVRLICKVTGQQIDQLHQLFVLFVNQRDAGFEIFIPRKYLNRIHLAAAKK